MFKVVSRVSVTLGVGYEFVLEKVQFAVHMDTGYTSGMLEAQLKRVTFRLGKPLAL